MSINPVQQIRDSDAVSREAARPETRSLEAKPAPNSGSPPVSEVSTLSSAAASSELPQDEVQVQRDDGAGGVIVIKYLDHAGEVILQVPSSEVLDMVRAIDQEFQQRAKAQPAAGTVETGNQGGKIRGH